jgi:SAM-dependent methyltransferase
MTESRQAEKLYTELASWYPLLTAPDEYEEEAASYRELLDTAGTNPPHTVLELGCGGGANASWLKAHYTMTLVDLSAGMLAVSKALNPACEHLLGDMRNVRLGRTFDAVFIHDAVVYMTSESDLRRALGTAAAHCKPGGALVVVPDCVRETFREGTKHGGHDGADGRSLRYLDWTWDPDPEDETYVSDFSYLLRAADGSVRCEYDRHVCGLFGIEDWMRLLREAGFEPQYRVSSVEGEFGDYLEFYGSRV